MASLDANPGTYVLSLQSDQRRSLRVGRREVVIESGYYLYVGSAFGPGGVRARISRHNRCSKPKHWHVDYLREVSILLRAWISYQSNRLEHVWANRLLNEPGLEAVTGFGCSDCRCDSHLFFASELPDLKWFAGCVGGKVEQWNARDD